ncbi:MAG: DUF72 domain-containing protein [Pseudomonadota bacterium]
MPAAIRIGTSGWHYAHWAGRFYPPGLGPPGWLTYYAARFPAVEVNNTFYRLPTADVFERWSAETPPGFMFAVKVSRYLTHFNRLAPRWDRYRRFFDTVAALGGRLGPLLFQLPPRFPPDPARLDDFLAAMPTGFHPAFEFRDPGWLVDPVLAVLERRRAALVFWDFEGTGPPLVETGDFVYVRLHGPGSRYQGSYSDAALAEWAARLRCWAGAGREAWCFLDNDDKAFAVTDAARLRAMLESKGPGPEGPGP